MTATVLAAILLAGVPTSVARAVTTFNSGEIYLRTIGMEPEEDFRRDSGTGIPAYAESCEPNAALTRELELWNTTMLKLWSGVNTEETRFTLRSGEEYLIYENFLLFYTSPECRENIPIAPEELWAVLSHGGREPSPVTSQISLEGFYTGLREPFIAFVSPDDPVFHTVELLLERGREASLQE